MNDASSRSRIASDQLRIWRERYARQVANIDFQPLSDAPFRAAFELILDQPGLAQAAFSPGLTFRDEELVKDGDDAFAFIIAQSKNLNLAHRGRDLSLRGGDAALVHVSEIGSVGSREHFAYAVVMMSQPELDTRGTRLDDTVMQRVWHRSEALQLLRGYLRSLKSGWPGSRAEDRETVRRHIFDLAVLALTPHGAIGESRLGAVASARLGAALECIAMRFKDPTFTLAALARSQGVSPRYLQRLIETTGTTFTAHVNELRLRQAFTLLTQSRDGASRISDVALQVGFSDISHFNRLFRSRFGETPSAVRRTREPVDAPHQDAV